MISAEIIHYVETTIFPKYYHNKYGQSIEHIQYVIDRSFKFAKSTKGIVNIDMVYVIAAYHDIQYNVLSGCNVIDSAIYLWNDINLYKWFTKAQMLIMKEAIEDHLNVDNSVPRTVYGKILLSANRNTNIDVIFKDAYIEGRKLYPAMTVNDLVEKAYEHVMAQYGDSGYRLPNMYFEDEEYDSFVKQIKLLLSYKNIFKTCFYNINNIHKQGLRDQIESYSPFNAQEIIDKKTMLDFIDTFSDVVTRKNYFGHFTASAFVLNQDETKAVLLHHKIMNDWIYPGGHADGEYDLCAVACREVEEETGLDVVPLFDGQIFSIQAAPVKGHVKKGIYVSAHIHYDILFIFKTKDINCEQLKVAPDENMAVEWWELDQENIKDGVVEWAQPVLKKIISKLRQKSEVNDNGK